MNCPGCGMFITDSWDRCPYCGTTLRSAPQNQSRRASQASDPYNDDVPVVFASDMELMGTGADVYEDCVRGVLEIHCTDYSNQAAWNGSGYLIDDEGYAITNAHVAATEKGKPVKKGEMVVTVCGQKIGAQVVALGDDKAGRGKGVDLALIKLDRLPQNYRALEFEDYQKVRNGEQVYIIGNSLGDGTCITAGIISDKRRTIEGKTVLMTDCAINGGNSGGPIFNQDGKVIGTICSHRISPNTAVQGMNYAIPADIVEAFLNKARR